MSTTDPPANQELNLPPPTDLPPNLPNNSPPTDLPPDLPFLPPPSDLPPNLPVSTPASPPPVPPFEKRHLLPLPQQPQQPQKVPTEFEILHGLYSTHYNHILQMIKTGEDKLKKENTTMFPSEFWGKVFRLLRPPAILSMSLTCTFFNRLSQEEDLWQRLYWIDTKTTDTILDKSERSWKMKFKYGTGRVTKEGILQKKSGLVITSWTAVWLVLSGFTLYIFNVRDIHRRTDELTNLAKNGLSKILEHNLEPVLTINLKQAGILRQSAPAKNGLSKFAIKTPTTELFFQSDEKNCQSWIKILIDQIRAITNDFSVTPFRITIQ